MYNEFYDIESLFDAVSKDRIAEGVTAIVQNRYPIRFVLFDNFCNNFTSSKNWCEGGRNTELDRPRLSRYHYHSPKTGERDGKIH